MEYLVIFFIALTLGAYMVWKVKSRVIIDLKDELRLAECEIVEIERIVSSIDEHNNKMSEVKEERKGCILSLLDEKGILQINKIMEELNLSRTTTYRYLEELENEKKIVQVGDFGRNVGYKRII